MLLWLKALLGMHWVTLIRRADKEDLQSLGMIQAFIAKKTKSLDRVLLLKGKLDMLSKTIELTKTVGKGEPAKQAPLVYRDAESDDEEMMASQESSDDEVIEEIKHGKRQRRDSRDQDDEDDGDDESMEEEKLPRGLDEEDDGIDSNGYDEEIDSEVYGQESQDDERLAESSSQDVAMPSEDEEVIRAPKKKQLGKKR